MLDILDLVELDDFLQPDRVGDEVSFEGDVDDVAFELVEIDGDEIDSREDVGEKTVEQEMSFPEEE